MSFKTHIAAHRGGAALWPENSPTAFRQSTGLDVEQIEFDVQMSADGVPMIHHDGTLDRTTSGEGALADKTLSALKELTLLGTDDERMMTLEEGLDILEPFTLTLRCEIKPGVAMRRYPELEVKVYESLKRRNLLERTVMTSFFLDILTNIRAWPEAPAEMIWLVAQPVVGCIGLERVIDIAKQDQIKMVGLHHLDLDDDSFSRIKAAGLKCSAWAVLEDAAIQRVLEMGVDVFTTDRPDAAIALRAAL